MSSHPVITKMRVALIVAVVILASVGGVVYYEQTQTATTQTTSQMTTQSTPPSIASFVITSSTNVFFGYPSLTTQGPDEISPSVYESLLLYNPSTDQFKPVLATNWTVSTDGLVWTFSLRKGVKFHTGNDFNATAVKYSIDNYISHQWGAYYIWSAVKSINIVDAYTVQFILNYPAPINEIASAGSSAFILDPYNHTVTATDNSSLTWFAQGHDTGSGPYTITSWKPEINQAVISKFDQYWGGWDGKHFDQVVISGVADTSTARLMLESGQVDGVQSLPYADIDQMKSEPNITIVTAPSWQNYFASIDTSKQSPPLNNKEVRQALSYSVPYQAIVDNVFSGYARQARGIVPYGLFGHDEGVFQYTYNLTKARELLAEAGYPNGGFSLTVVYLGHEEGRRICDLWGAELSKLGITLNAKDMTINTAYAAWNAPNPKDRPDIIIAGWWPDYADPYSFFINLLHTGAWWGVSRYNNAQFDHLVDEALNVTGTNRQLAAQLYSQAQQMASQDAPMLYFVDYVYALPFRSSLKGYTVNALYPYIYFWYDCYRA